MDKDLFDALVSLLLPQMSDEADRKALIESALFGCAVLNGIDWKAAATTFTPRLVKTLDDFGDCEPDTPALVPLLRKLKERVGSEKQPTIDGYIMRLQGDKIPALNLIALPQVENQDLYIFISYARPQQAIAQQLEQALRHAGVKVFRDTSDIRSGSSWDMTIEQALNDADRMVLLLSSASMPYRKEVHREWFYFDQERKPIYPLYVEDCKLHSRMYAYNYIDARSGLQGAIAKLISELGKDYELPEAQVNADRIIVVEQATERPLPDALKALLEAIRDPKGSVALTPDETREIILHKPKDFTEYRLGRIAEWSQPRYQLDNRFVNLTLLIDQGEEAQQRWLQPESTRKFNDLRDVLQVQGDAPAFVLLGAPGSGKSTLLRRLQLDDAIDRLLDNGAQATFFIQLNSYSLSSPEPRVWLNAQWSERYPNLPRLDDLLGSGRMLLLLDALNEMPHTSTQDYHERVGRWRSFTQAVTGNGNRVIYSCRSLDYSASLSSKELRVPQVVVQPMTAEQVHDFLQKYLPAYATMVWHELDGSPQFDIFRTPYFLKLLTDQVETSSTIPKGRASLFTGFVRQALQREISGGNALFAPDTLLSERDHTRLTQAKWRSPVELPERGILIPKLAQLAFAMQEQRIATEGATLRVDYDDACDLLNHERHEDLLKAGVALNVLDEDVAQLEILFFHQLLQEFFAARQLAKQPEPERVRVAWQVADVQPTLEAVLATLPDSDPLPALPQTGWEETTLLAAAMVDNPDTFVRDLLAVNLPLAARCAAASDVQVSDALKAEIRQALIERTQNPEADLRARIAAGLALGTIGDPRFERRTGKHGDYLMPPLVTIEGGTYPIGADDSQYDDEKPAHTVTLDSFQLGKFPVTNAEYALFITAGSYDDEQWWETEQARAWRKGEAGSDGQKASWRDTRKRIQSWSEDSIRNAINFTSKQKEDFFTIRRWTDEQFQDWLDEQFPSGTIYRQPGHWNDTTYNNPNQPVVGITWFEARAYCRWLAAQTGLDFDLPSEAQWEAAVRGKIGRLYAYGATFDSAKCNTFESHIRRTTPIGVFPGGDTSEGLVDMTGNVYDWTNSIFDQTEYPYPYSPDDGREDVNRTDGSRVLRGGSWYALHNNARAVYRNYDFPFSRNFNFGFRLLCRF